MNCYVSLISTMYRKPGPAFTKTTCSAATCFMSTTTATRRCTTAKVLNCGGSSDEHVAIPSPSAAQLRQWRYRLAPWWTDGLHRTVCQGRTLPNRSDRAEADRLRDRLRRYVLLHPDLHPSPGPLHRRVADRRRQRGVSRFDQISASWIGSGPMEVQRDTTNLCRMLGKLQQRHTARGVRRCFVARAAPERGWISRRYQNNIETIPF